jgi:hypothetical protein
MGYLEDWENEVKGKTGEGKSWWETAFEVINYPFQQMGMAFRRTYAEPWQLYAGAKGTPWERMKQVDIALKQEPFAPISPIAAIPLSGEAAKSRFMPSGREYQEYRALPLWQQLAFEAPGMAATFALPAAGALRAGLAPAAKAGKVIPRVARAGLKPAEAVEAGISKITDPILSKLKGLMQAQRVARKATTRVRKVALKERVAKAQKIYDSTLKKTGDPELARRVSMRELRGEYPTVRAEALGEALTQEEGKTLMLKVGEHPTLQYFERTRAQIALNKLLQSEEILQPAELKLLERVFPGITELNILKLKMGNTAWRNFVDAANLPRALLASTDLSFTLRQGGILLARFPGEFKGTLNAQLKTLFSQKNWKAIDDIIRTDPDFGVFDQIMKVYQAPEPGAIAALGAREEYFMSRLAEKIPFVKVSERAFTAGGNYLRFRAAKNFLEIARRAGMTDEATLEGLGKLINWASGRGALPRWAGRSAPIVNAFLFAPRFVFSRLQLPTLLFHSSPLVRKEAARTLVQFLGAGVSVLSLASLAGAKIELDPRSSDFGKIKVGNTRLDIWAGYVQWVRFLSQLLTAESKLTGTGEIIERQRIDTVWNLLQSKESPMASIFTDLLKGETYLGEPIFEGGWSTFAREMRNRLTPLFAQDLWDAIETDSLKGGLAATPGMLGVGVVSYEERQRAATGGGLPELPSPELPSLR